MAGKIHVFSFVYRLRQGGQANCNNCEWVICISADKFMKKVLELIQNSGHNEYYY
jgi:hypothetical protein